jgi:nitroreductase
MAEALDAAPALLLLLADLTALAAVDRDLDRYGFAGGASIYPFAWNLLLAARAEGLGGVITTMPIRREADVRQLFAIPDTLAVAALIVLGRPVSAARRLRRASVEEFTWVDRFGGPTLGGDSQDAH